MFDLLRNLFSSNESVDEERDESSSQDSPSPVFEFDRLDEQPFGHYTEAVEEIKTLKREGRHAEAEELLLWCIDFVEGEARAYNYEPAKAYYRHLAIVYRKDERYQDEVELLERYTSVCAEVDKMPHDELLQRLERARELAEA